jgi:invasion protein IalB
MRPAFLFLAACCLLPSLASVAASETTTRLRTSGAWEAYSYSDRSGKICYAAASADRTVGGGRERQGTAIAVSHRPKSAGEVSIMAPYGLKKGSQAELQIAGMKHAFDAKGTVAWATDAKADPAIIQQMLKGREIVVRTVPEKGQAITDTIPLKGFRETLAAIDKACDVKR